MKKIILFLFFIALFSCNRKTTIVDTTEKDTTNKVSDTVYIDSKGGEYKFLGQIPDSLRTIEQTELIKKLTDITVEYMTVKDNHLVFLLSKEEFLAKGIPERYYKIIQQNLVDNNTFYDANGIKNVEEMIKKRNEEYKQQRNLKK